jgi:hypothetical protein
MTPSTTRARGVSRVVVPAASLAAALLLAGCAPAPAPPVAPPAASPTAPAVDIASEETDDVAPCGLLDAAVASDLAGLAVTGVEHEIAGSDVLACMFGDLGSQGVQVMQLQADEWAAQLPGVVESLRSMPEGTFDASLLQQLDEASTLIEEGGRIPPAEACGYFSRLTQVQGYPEGTTRVLNTIPAGAGLALTGQQCIDDTFTSVTVGRSDLTEEGDLGERLLTALDSLG